MLQYDRAKLGAYLKSCRCKANLTQADASEKLGYTSSQFVSNIERGVSVAPLRFLARAMALYKADTKQLERIILSSQESILLAKLSMVPKMKDRKKNPSKVERP